MKELPKVFHNKVNKNFNNNRSFYYSNNEPIEEEEKKDTRTITQKINDIFSSPNYIYKANVEITLKDKKIVKRIIGRNKISINDIIDIKSLKK